MSERQLHTAVVQFLEVALPHEALLHHSPGEGQRGWKAQRDLKSSGHKKGWPDLEILYGSKAYFIELKKIGKYPTAEQREMHDRIRRAGCECFVARSLEEVVLAMETWAIPLSAKLLPTGGFVVNDPLLRERTGK